jgi:hypothetical protein
VAGGIAILGAALLLQRGTTEAEGFVPAAAAAAAPAAEPVASVEHG